MLISSSIGVNELIEKLKLLKLKDKDFENSYSCYGINYIDSIITLYDNLFDNVVEKPKSKAELIDYKNFTLCRDIIMILYNIFCGIYRVSVQDIFEDTEIYAFYMALKNKKHDVDIAPLTTRQIMELLR